LKGNNFFFNIRGKQKISAGGIRKILVTIQYVVSVGMIIATAIIFSQMHFLKNHDLGFIEDNILVINTPDDTSYHKHADKFVASLRDHPGVLGVSATRNVPGYTMGKLMFHVSDTGNMGLKTVDYFAVDHHFFDVLDIQLLAGELFAEGTEKDSVRKYILNEAAVEYLDLDDPVGSKLDATLFEDFNGEVIGVVNNFHSGSLHSEIEPLIFLHWPNKSRYILVKAEPEQQDAVFLHVKSNWHDFNKGHFMHYTYLDQKMKSLYSSDYKMLSLFIYFSIFVIFISSLGLYGLSSFLIEQRIKEIGIRKVLGGSENQITMLLAKDYLKLVLFAGIIASPFVYFLMGSWLDGFAIHVNINGWYFVLGILLIMLFAFLTVLVRSYNAVRRSPAAALKYE
jgi:putative ABC transport system permease protein